MIFDHDTDTTFNHFNIEDYNFEILKLKNSSLGAHSSSYDRYRAFKF